MAKSPPAWTIPAPPELGAEVVAAAAEELALREAEDRAELAEAEAELIREDAEAEIDDAPEEAELSCELALALTLERRLDADALSELRDAVAEAVADPLV